jgi:hypothetical protein
MRQEHHVFLAEGLHAGETDPDPEEADLVSCRVSVTEFEEMVLRGEIMDNCTLAAWGLYLIWKRKSK